MPTTTTPATTARKPARNACGETPAQEAARRKAYRAAAASPEGAEIRRLKRLCRQVFALAGQIRDQHPEGRCKCPVCHHARRYDVTDPDTMRDDLTAIMVNAEVAAGVLHNMTPPARDDD